MNVSTRINLLPWREEERKRQNIEFGIMAAAAALFAVVVVAGVYMYFDDRISYQNQRNSFINNEITVLNSKLETIKDLESQKQSLLDRMNIIQKLQGSRPETVHLFEELVTTIPDGIWLTLITQSDRKISISGVTESNARVSAYMRNLNESAWMSNPQLQTIKKDGEKKTANFNLSIQQDSPFADNADE